MNAPAGPRRSAKAATLRIRTDRSSATVTTSPTRTGRLAPSMRWPFTRTWPDAASAAAAERVRTTRACQSHLSMRWRSNVLAPLLGVGLELLFERRQLGKGRIRIRCLVATVAVFTAALEVFGTQLGIALGAIAAFGPVRTP